MDRIEVGGEGWVIRSAERAALASRAYREQGSGDRRAEQLETFRAAVASRYRIDGEVGEGGHGRVLRATDLRHRRTVAIKVLQPEPGSGNGSARFRREIRVVAALHHPHILPLYDSGCEDGIRFFVMPFVEGASLRERLRRDGRLPVREALGIARQVASALVEAHGRGIVHRDIKPENILLSRRAALLADFGIACAVDDSEMGDLTAPGIVLGTPVYMSPEQGAPGERIDGRADIYSLGCVLYEMLGGAPPFGGDSAQAILARHAAASTPNIADVRPDVSSAVSRLLHRALAKSPDDRFEACEFEAALDAAMTCLAMDEPTSLGWKRRGALMMERLRAALL